MKRTLVERVAIEMYNHVTDTRWDDVSVVIREARRIIAMVRRHDRKEKGKV